MTKNEFKNLTDEQLINLYREKRYLIVSSLYFLLGNLYPCFS